MPKYAEGTVSPSGRYIVHNGKWIPKTQLEISQRADERAKARSDARVAEATERRARVFESRPPGGGFGSAAFPTKIREDVSPQQRQAILESQGKTAAAAAATGAALPLVASGGPPAAAKVLAFLNSPVGGATVGGAEGYRRGGVPGMATGALAGAAVPATLGKAGKLLNFLLRFGRPTAAAAETAAVGAEAGTAATEAAAIAEKIRTLKGAQGLSDAQVIQSLRELYGFSSKNAKDIFKLVMGGA